MTSNITRCLIPFSIPPLRKYSMAMGLLLARIICIYSTCLSQASFFREGGIPPPKKDLQSPETAGKLCGLRKFS